jgi:hypothetical protein
MRAVNLDTDWFLRMPGRLFLWFCQSPLIRLGKAIESAVFKCAGWFRSLAQGSVHLENRFDYLFHHALTSVPMRILERLKPLNTEASQLAWNMIYVLVPFIILLVTILILVI